MNVIRILYEVHFCLSLLAYTCLDLQCFVGTTYMTLFCVYNDKGLLSLDTKQSN